MSRRSALFSVGLLSKRNPGVLVKRRRPHFSSATSTETEGLDLSEFRLTVMLAGWLSRLSLPLERQSSQGRSKSARKYGWVCAAVWIAAIKRSNEWGRPESIGSGTVAIINFRFAPARGSCSLSTQEELESSFAGAKNFCNASRPPCHASSDGCG